MVSSGNQFALDQLDTRPSLFEMKVGDDSTKLSVKAKTRLRRLATQPLVQVALTRTPMPW